EDVDGRAPARLRASPTRYARHDGMGHSISLIARMSLRSTLIMSPCAGNASACRSCGETARPCRITRPSAVRKIEDAASLLSFQTSSTRNFTATSRCIARRSVHAHRGSGIKPVARALTFYTNLHGRTTMPDKRTIEKARKDKREGKAPTTQAGEF